MTTKRIAELVLIVPAGISLRSVRTFFASKSLSTILLKAIAALLANTMHRMIKPNSCHSKGCPENFNPRKNDNTANGSAKTVWANLMRDK